jgi:hypothetical protein
MKSKSYESTQERTILTALIVHDGILERITKHMKGRKDPFRSKWSNIVAKWCFAYHDKYKKAPRRAIETLFKEFEEGQSNDEMAAIVGNYLEGLNEDYLGHAKELNEDYIVDLASSYFERIRLERLAKDIQMELEKGDVGAAGECITAQGRIDFSSARWIDPSDPEIIARALKTSREDSVVQWPGAMDEFMSRYFERDGFIAFAGPEKIGKTWWLIEVAYRALMQKRKVLFYCIGDLSEAQMERRLLTRFIKRPIIPRMVVVPTKIMKRGDRVLIRGEERHFKTILKTSEAVKAWEKIKAVTACKQLRLKVRCAGASTIAAGDIERDVADLAKEEWIPDVVIIDYADLLLGEGHCKTWDYRNQINETWKVLRRISQSFHNLVVTATQTAATSYDKKLISKSDFSEDKRKNAHVTGMIGLNQTSEEKQIGLYRLNWLFLREGSFASNDVVYTASSLSLGCPCVISKRFNRDDS